MKYRRSTRKNTSGRNRRRSTRSHKMRGGGDCPAGFTETDSQGNAAINNHSGKPNNFNGILSFKNREGVDIKVKILVKEGFVGGYCVDEPYEFGRFAKNASGYVRNKAKTNAVFTAMSREDTLAA